MIHRSIDRVIRVNNMVIIVIHRSIDRVIRVIDMVIIVIHRVIDMVIRVIDMVIIVIHRVMNRAMSRVLNRAISRVVPRVINRAMPALTAVGGLVGAVHAVVVAVADPDAGDTALGDGALELVGGAGHLGCRQTPRHTGGHINTQSVGANRL